MDKREKAVEDFLVAHSEKTEAIVTFLANAKLTNPVYNTACTKVKIGLKYGSQKVWIEFDTDPVNSFFGSGYCAKLAEALFKSFRLRQPFRELVDSRNWHVGIYDDVVNGLVRRGGILGFAKIGTKIGEMYRRNEPPKKLHERRIQTSLNRADSAMRQAVKNGATVQQLQKLARAIAAEKSVEKIHEN